MPEVPTTETDPSSLDDDTTTLRKKPASSIDSTLNCVDFNCNGDFLAVAGNEAKIKIYDENSNSKDFVMTLKPQGKNFPGHSKRIFSLKFDNESPSLLYSGGWDDTV